MSVPTRGTLTCSLVALLLWSCSAPAHRELHTATPPVLPAGRSAAPHAPVARQEAEASAPVAEADGWRTVVSPYVWALSVDGHTTFDRYPPVVQDSDGILDELNLAFGGRIEAWKGDWGWIIDLTYARPETESVIDLGMIVPDVETTTELAQIFVGALHRVVEQEPMEGGEGGLEVDLLFGLLYTEADVDIDFADFSGGFDGHESWVDPLFGIRSRFDFGPKWGGSLEMDVGGFDLFDGSELVTRSTALVGRKFAGGRVLYFGWRIMDIGSEQDDFEVDMTLDGPMVGFEWSS